MNEVVLIGNLTKDPDVRQSQNNNSVCRFTVAVNDRKKNPVSGEWEDNASYIPVVVFGKQADNCGRFLAKGRKVAVKGRLQSGSYEKNGQKIYTMDVIATVVEFLTPASEKPQEPAQNVPVGFEQVAEQEHIPF